MFDKLEIIRTWTPRAAVVLAALIFLAAFWGIVVFGFRFFGSYFTPEIQTKMSVPGIYEEQTTKLREFIKQRTQKRDSVGNYQDLGQKDPFNLP